MNRYEIIEELASGVTATVYKAYDVKNKEHVAIKKYKRRCSVEQTYRLGELKALLDANHPYVIQLLEVMRSGSGTVVLIFEYMDASLLDVIRSNPGTIRESRVRNIMYQILSGLNFLHSVKRVIHCDLKSWQPENILLTSGEVCKIADLGEAQHIDKHPPFAEYMMTRWYRAPEVLLRLEYSAAIDVWSAGCIFAELLTGTPLFPGVSESEQLSIVFGALGGPDERWHEAYAALADTPLTKFASRFRRASAEAVQLIGEMLSVWPPARPSARTALEFPFFSLSITA